MQIGIVGHISRSDEAHALLERLDADVLKMDDSDFFSIWDATRRCAENHIRVLTHLHSIADGPQDWLVIVEDDAIPVPGFRTEASAALRCAPTELVCLYLGTGNPSGNIQRGIREAIGTPGPWFTADFFVGAVGWAVRSHLVPDLLKDIERRDDELPLRVTRWSQKRGILTSYTRPSLVDHLDIDSTIASMPTHERAKMPRKAWEFGSRQNWEGRPVMLPRDPEWSATYP